MAKTTKQYIKSFLAAWGASVVARIKAAKIYAAAANTKQSGVKAQFWMLPGFDNWSEDKWSLLYHIGNNDISPVFIDVDDPSVPISMHTHKIPIPLQEDIFQHGMTVATITGRSKHLRYSKMRQHHIDLKYKNYTQLPADATTCVERTHQEQIAWLESRERSNVYVRGDGDIQVGHGCKITKQQLISLLSGGPSGNDPVPLGIEVLQAVITRLSRRNNNG